jgi:hypothetical protein
VVKRESRATELLPQRPKFASEKYADPVEVELKGGLATLKDAKVGAATDDSNPYSIEGAINGLLEVGGIEAPQSPKKQKKLAKTAAKDKATARPAKEASNKVRSKAGKNSHRALNV